MHSYIISIGSNYERKKNLVMARRRLEVFFPSIRFGKEEETVPLGLSNPDMFTNQVAKFVSDLSETEVIVILKLIERESGRRPEDKAKEKISLDIDLLSCDDRILKPEDMQREYIIRGIK